MCLRLPSKKGMGKGVIGRWRGGGRGRERRQARAEIGPKFLYYSTDYGPRVEQERTLILERFVTIERSELELMWWELNGCIA